MAISEEELIEGCKAGKRDLQKALYQRYSAKMLMVCLRYSKNRTEAEDMLQDGFVKLFNNIHQYTGPGSFEGWIRRIMVNTALEAIRKKKMDFSPEDIYNLSTDQAGEHDAMSKIALKDLLAIIMELPAGCRVIFNLYVIEGYNHREIGEKLAISEGTSKSQLARARQLLQEKIRVSYEPKELVK